MRKVAILLILLALVKVVYAHPPVKIEISFDRENNLLTAKIIHPVEDPKTHYINNVDISINSKEILKHEISRQDNENEQVVIYRLPDVKESDTIGVEGYCSISGVKEEDFKIK